MPRLLFCSHSCHKGTMLSCSVMQEKGTRPLGPGITPRLILLPFACSPLFCGVTGPILGTRPAGAPRNPMHCRYFALSLQLRATLSKGNPRADRAPGPGSSMAALHPRDLHGPGTSEAVIWSQESMWAEQRDVLGPVQFLPAGVPPPSWAQEWPCWDKQLAEGLGGPGHSLLCCSLA